MSPARTPSGPHLREARYEPPDDPRSAGFPFTLPALSGLSALDLDHPVTFLVGENGSGKSTLLEALAVATKLPVLGGEAVERDPTLAPARALAARLRLAWRVHPHKGFFLRAEDFFRFARRITESRAEYDDLEKEFAGRFSGYGRRLATGVARGARDALERRYGDLEARSHGESFLDLFRARFVPGGLHLLDEPETPLSPARQIALLSMLDGMVRAGGQFIIATHSPILMAHPDAAILSFDERPPAPVAWDTLPHVTLTRDFLNHPGAFLRHLSDESPEDDG